MGFLTLFLLILDDDAIDVDWSIRCSIRICSGLGFHLGFCRLLGFPTLLLRLATIFSGFDPFSLGVFGGGRGACPPQKANLVAIVEGGLEQLVIQVRLLLVLGFEDGVDQLSVGAVEVGRLDLLDELEVGGDGDVGGYPP